MRAKTVATILIVFISVWFVVSTIRLNETIVTMRFALFQAIELELWMVMLASFSAGAGIILTFDLAGVFRRFVLNRRLQRASKAQERVEDLYMKGLDAMLNGRYKKALERFEKILTSEPNYENALIKRGDSLCVLKRYQEAAESLEQAIQLAPDNLMALYSLTEVHFAAGDDEKAQLVLEQIVSLQPKSSISAHRKLRELLIRENKWDEASDLQKHILNMVSNKEDMSLEKSIANGLHLGMGVTRLEQGQLGEALAIFRSVLKQDELFVPGYVRLGEALVASGDSEEAIATWRRGNDVTGSVEPLIALQDFYLHAERPEEAISIWKQALVLADNEMPFRFCLGKLYYKLFMLDEALCEFELVEDQISGFPALNFYVAQILESKKNHSDALLKIKALLEEAEALTAEYMCSNCELRVSEWGERCDQCGQFGQIALNLPVVTPPEPFIHPSPTWSTP